VEHPGIQARRTKLPVVWGLLSPTGGASGNPSAQNPARLASCQKRGNRRLFHLLPDGRVSKKIGHPNQEFFEKEIHFLGIFPEKADVAVHAVDLVDSHSPRNASEQRGWLVNREIMSGAFAYENDRFVK
jgi:hypothetical protein